MEAIVCSPSPSKTSPTFESLLHQLGIREAPHGNSFVEEQSQAGSPRILSALSCLLERMVAANDAHCTQFGHISSNSLHRLTLFHGLRAPSISVQNYVDRIFKYANCSPSCFVAACVYLDRFVQQQPGLPITSLNVHRLLITSVMAAAKFLDDSYYNNAYYAKIGGVSTEEINRLELEFLFRLGFRLHVTVQEFNIYCLYLERGLTELHPHDTVEGELPLPPLQEKNCLRGAGQMVEKVHEAEQQNNVYVAVKLMEPVS